MTNSSNNKDDITAAMIAIGDELLSGRTKDKNIGFLADELTVIGIDLKEVRIIPDDVDIIVDTVNSLRLKYNYIFTSGGIGPTHDDMTALAVSKAFSRQCIYDKRADDILRAYYNDRNVEYTQSRRLMTRMPEGCQIIENSISGAPGFSIENVYVMAGVPNIFKEMVVKILPQLKKGKPYLFVSIACPFGEGVIAEPLRKIQENNENTIIGSYPHFDENGFSLDLIVRSRSKKDLEKAVYEVRSMINEKYDNV
ncbi:competence/damage-inducible protein A [Bartonella tamiae]|uniref:Molybdenum cofactor synthesis domain-containing protein n=1 Tax=Bartonella tamiae Th239 TaxID=1094558 RepID=J1JV43_9HYPH|nr:competence/damage-inducible protein A [Bartonella tamiae]EJF88842.1 molybdenum cofactor synthesis domain-containing protein [Bartonella tamiae Th239]EJF94908.1 molybdenum cofactor synthesis domain-containing protein [Bartonella tamiae Th307]